jgi:hypothetical protein
LGQPDGMLGTNIEESGHACTIESGTATEWSARHSPSVLSVQSTDTHQEGERMSDVEDWEHWAFWGAF